MRVAICDDEEVMVRVIHQRLVEEMKKYTDKKIDISDFVNGKDLLAANEALPFDVIFLDINMPDMDGRKIAKTLNLNYKDQVIIYISSYDEFVYDVIFESPAGFIRKAKMEQDFPKAVKSMLKKHREIAEVVELNCLDGKIKLRTNNIWYFVAEKHFVKAIYPRNKEVHYKISLTDLEEVLKDMGFLRVHKSFLVNYQYIRRIDDYNNIIMDDGITKIKISRYRIKEMKKRYFELMSNHH